MFKLRFMPREEKFFGLFEQSAHTTVLAAQELKRLVDIPENMWEDCLNHCFKYLESGDEPVAIKVFSMTILYNLSNKIPEIKNELKILIENQLPFSSAGYKSRGSKILKKLNMETGPTS